MELRTLLLLLLAAPVVPLLVRACRARTPPGGPPSASSGDASPSSDARRPEPAGGAGLADVRSSADLEVIAVRMPNRDDVRGRPWTDFRTSVDALEAATGYDLLDALPDAVEREVEARR